MKTGNSIHWPSALQFGLSALAIFNLWSGAAVLILLGIAGALTGEAGQTDATAIFILTASLAALGILAIPSAYYPLLRLLDRRPAEFLSRMRLARPSLLVFLLLPLLALGYGASQVAVLSWLLLPLVHVLVIGLSALWLVYLAARGLPLGSAQRRWGVFNAGMLLGPTIIMLAEIAVAVVMFIFAIFYIAARPDLVQEMERLAQWLANAGPTSDMAIQRLAPYLMSPTVILGLLAFTAVLVPLIEEMFKTVGVWFLVGQNLRPSAGFAAGALSGAGYAFIESLLLAGSGGEWAPLVIARFGTSAMHIFTSALMGYALVLAWRKSRYLQLGGLYLLSVAIHGLWNTLSVVTAVNALAGEAASVQAPVLVSRLAAIAPGGLGLITLGAVIGLVWMNRSLAQNEIPEQEPLAALPAALEAAPDQDTQTMIQGNIE